MIFYFLAASLTLLAVGYVVPSLLNLRSILMDDSVAQNALIASQRIREVTVNNHDEKTIDNAEDEIEAALAEDITLIHAIEYKSTPTVFSILAIAALLIISGSTYKLLGSPGLIAKNTEIAVHQEIETADIAVLIKQLEQKLADDPENPRGWELAGQTYMSMGSYEKAEHAYVKLNSLASGNADFLSALADASIMANGNTYTETAQSAVQQALKLNPNHINSLWIAGLGAGSLGENRKAIEYLERLKPLLIDNEEALLSLEQLITENQNKLDAFTDSTELSDSKEATPGKRISVEISIGDEIKAIVSGTETIFVIARAKSGPPAPLAVFKFSVRELPKTVTLTADMAMIPGMNIDAFDEIEVLARASVSGQPLAQQGDFQSREILVTGKASDQPIKLEISTPVIVE